MKFLMNIVVLVASVGVLSLGEEPFYDEVDSSVLAFSTTSMLPAPLGQPEGNLSNLIHFGDTIDEQTISLLNEDSSSGRSRFLSFDEALEQAKREHKIVLLEVVTTNCQFCKKMEKEVLSKERVQEALAKEFVLAQVNADKQELPLGLSTQMTPMFVFISEKENVEDMRLGYIELENFLELLVEEYQKIH